MIYRLLTILALAFTPAHAVTPPTQPTVVTNTLNTGAGSLRQAVLNANANPGADAITFDPTVFATAQTIVLATSNFAPFTGDTTVTGPAAGVTVQGVPSVAGGVFTVGAGTTASFSKLTINSGQFGILNNGTLTASNCGFFNNGIAGISNVNTATVTGCSFEQTGIYNGALPVNGAATLTVSDCSFTDFPSGAISNNGTATMSGCTTDNSMTAGEATLSNTAGATLTLTNCSLLQAQGFGLFSNEGTLAFQNCTLSEVEASLNSGTVTLKNTIYRKTPDTGTANVGNLFTDGGGNLLLDRTGNLAADLTTLGLDPTGLQNNGGPTKTFKLLGGAAINGGVPANVPGGVTTDQRGSGFPRSVGTVDIGAVEHPAPVQLVATTASAAEGTGAGTTAFTFTVSRPGATTSAVTLNYAITGTCTNPADAADFGGTLPSGTLTLPIGVASDIITIAVSKDATIELDETFTLTLSAPTANHAIAGNGAVATITNDDFVPPNSAPTDITLSANSIAENNTPGATIGTLTATDADAGDTHTFAFAGLAPAPSNGSGLASANPVNDNAAFTLTGNVLSINDSADFETKSSYSIRIRATDNGSPEAFFEKDFTITISDVNESSGPRVRYETGTPIVGAPSGTTFHALGALPAEIPGGEILATIQLPGGQRVSALVNDRGLVAKPGDVFAAAGGATFKKLYALAYGAFLAELTIGSGTPAVTKATSKVACFYNGRSIELLARTGSAAPGTAATFMHLDACAGDAQGNVFLKARTNEAGSLSTGVWVRPSGGSVALLVKQGQTVDIGNGNQRVDLIAAFPHGYKSQAEGRVHYGEDSIIMRLTVDGGNAIVAIPASATSAGDWTIIAKTGDDAPDGVGKYYRLGLPSAEGTQVAFNAVLVASTTVTSANDKIIVLGEEIIARKGDTAPGTGLPFFEFDNPCAGGPGRGSFTARLAGASSTTKLGLWEYREEIASFLARDDRPSGSLHLVARVGSAAPALGNPALTIRSITRNAHPGGTNGPLFVATLNGATRTTNTVLYAVAPDGTTNDLARTGDQFFVAGAMRTLTLLYALNYNVGNEGVARGYDQRQVFFYGGFGIRMKALISLPLEEERRPE